MMESLETKEIVYAKEDGTLFCGYCGKIFGDQLEKSNMAEHLEKHIENGFFDDTMHDILEDHGFFAYHGDGQGDHYRKKGFGGHKFIVYSPKVKHKNHEEAWGGDDWGLVKTFENVEKFDQYLTNLLERGE